MLEVFACEGCAVILRHVRGKLQPLANGETRPGGDSKMTLREKQDALAADLSRFKNPQDRLAHMIRLGRAAAGLDEKFKTPEARLEGCLSNLWLRSEFRDGLCFFRADSDSAIVKGLATVICDLFSALPPEEILKADLAPLRQAGLWQQLTPNRRTGLSRLVDNIHEFAREHLPK